MVKSNLLHVCKRIIKIFDIYFWRFRRKKIWLELADLASEWVVLLQLYQHETGGHPRNHLGGYNFCGHTAVLRSKLQNDF